MTAHDNQENTESKRLLDSGMADEDGSDLLDGDALGPDESDEFTFAFAEHEKTMRLSRLVAPALVLILATGAGGYIVSNSSVLSRPGIFSDQSTTTTVAANSTLAQNLNNMLPAAGDTPTPLTGTSTVTPTPAATPPQLAPGIPSMVPAAGSLTGLSSSTTTTTTTTVPPAVPGAAPSTTTTSTTATTATATPAAAAVSPAATPAANAAAVPAANIAEVAGAQAPALPPPDSAAKLTPVPVAAPAGLADIGKNVEQQAKQNSTTAAPAAMTPDANLPPVGAGAMPNPGPDTGTAAAPITPMPKDASTGPDLYYDSASGGGAPPTGPLANVGPRKLNPVDEPASKFVVVQKDEGPQGMDSQITAADRALKLGRYDAAADMYDALYAKNRRDPRILMGRAVAYQNTGRTDSALKTYDELLDVDPGNADALVNMLGLLRKQYPEVALRRLMNLHEKFPNNATVTAQIGVTEGDQGQLDDAMRYLEMAVSMEPNNAQHQFNLAVVADRAGKKDDAAKYYEQALETDAVYGGSRSVPRDQIYDRLAALRQHL